MPVTFIYFSPSFWNTYDFPKNLFDTSIVSKRNFCSLSLHINTLRYFVFTYVSILQRLYREAEESLLQSHSQLLLSLNSREDKLSMLNAVHILIYFLFLDSQQIPCIFFLSLPAFLLNQNIAQKSRQDLCRQNGRVSLQKNQYILSLKSCLSYNLLLLLLSLR